ncbi:D-glutamate cyclase, mitochondrial-like [Branchiostoma floridae]|uniref:D-glutamate cyclase, mitochondrial-like n=1 Tax=Branchiostoma floridae TaxID=7739 RepID=A0A9J7LD37_BRAFL|nr:D-glutamate cyclase, mitochondrial-like [Branchiostoma floridae]
MHKAHFLFRQVFKFPSLREISRYSGKSGFVLSLREIRPASDMASDGSFGEMHPKDLRSLIRSGNMHGRNTSGMCKGRIQANIAIVHKSLAQDFEKFCQANAGPLPLLYMSEVGEYGAPPLAEDSDIRTDVALYSVYRDGTLTEKVGDLSEFTEQLKDMVTFYIGCSFSFEDAVMSAGVPVRNLEQGVCVSMYEANIPCHPVGPFQCKMFLTMRPIPKDKLDVVYRITHHMPDVHGAPIHIGDPAMIGIPDLTADHVGDIVEFQPGDVPVFWCCGVTTQPSVQSAKSSLAFTHSPGCMFVADAMATVPTTTTTDPADTPKVVQVSQEPLLYSVASELAVDQIHRLEKAVQADPGRRGISDLHIPGELLRCVLSLSHASSVAIITGFPCHTELTPPEENDGPPGAVAMAAMLQALGKQVTMVMDASRLQLMRDIVEDCVQTGVLKEGVSVLPYPPTNGTAPDRDSALQFLTHDGDVSRPRYDHLVAIERVGRAADGTYRTMQAKDISSLVSPIDQLFEVANEEIPGIKTTGIGDGGNELGMGRVQEKVHQYITNGPEIACAVQADYTITAGVSNWGGWAVAAGLYVLQACPIHDRYLRRAVGFPRDSRKPLGSVPSLEREEKVMSVMIKHGLRDGMTAELGLVVDGLQFGTEHAQIMENLRTILGLD